LLLVVELVAVVVTHQTVLAVVVVLVDIYQQVIFLLAPEFLTQ
jgi:hypothetical protein